MYCIKRNNNGKDYYCGGVKWNTDYDGSIAETIVEWVDVLRMAAILPSLNSAEYIKSTYCRKKCEVVEISYTSFGTIAEMREQLKEFEDKLPNTKMLMDLMIEEEQQYMNDYEGLSNALGQELDELYK